jgi:hypothetical protein
MRFEKVYGYHFHDCTYIEISTVLDIKLESFARKIAKLMYFEIRDPSFHSYV